MSHIWLSLGLRRLCDDTDALGQLIEQGAWETIAANPKYFEMMEGSASYLAGSQIPDLILYPAADRFLLENSIRVLEPTPISTLIKLGMGHLDWAACRECL